MNNTADAWLANRASNDTNTWPSDAANVVDNATPPPTPVATDDCTAHGIYRACSCPQHQAIYDIWPIRNVYLYIAAYIRRYIYCGNDCKTPPNLRKHMAKMECLSRNLEIIIGKSGRNCSIIPEWTPKEPGPGTSQLTPEPPGHEPDAITTRSQAAAHSTTTIQLE